MDTMDTASDRWMSCREAADHIGVAEQTLRNWLATGNPYGVPSWKIGKRRSFRRDALDEWLASRKDP